MSLRKYFGSIPPSSSKPAAAPKSVLTEIKDKASSCKKAPPKRSPKRVPTVHLDEEDSDESPLPSSLKSVNSKKKRQRVILSDSDDDVLDVVEEKLLTRDTPATKRSRVITSESPSPAKETRKGRKKTISPVKEDSEQEVMETDSEDEFTERPVKGKKKDLPKGQKKLNFASQDKKLASAPTAKKRSGQAIDPFTFFGGTSSSTVGNKEKNGGTAKKNKMKAEMSEDSFDDSPIKEKETPQKKKGKVERDEFSEDSSEESPIKSKRGPSQEERKAQKMMPSPVKVRSDPPKATASAPLSAKVSKSQPVTTTNEPEKDLFVPWVDKYKPRTLQQLVGQHGDKSPMKKLMAWLKGWKSWHLGEAAKIRRPKPPPGVETDGSPFKAVLLSGPPGIGKTTCAHMACELAGFKVVEMNASDVRNKKHLDAHVAQLTGSHQLEEYFGGLPNESRDDTEVHHVLIMDEVDGMSGNEDRAGISELIAIIKDTKIPIICICNDRGHQKMRTLANHTHDIRFPKPRAEMLLSRVMTICCQEKLALSKEEALELIEHSGHDVRQTIYNLQLRAVAATGSKRGNVQEKDYTINNFEAARRLLGQSATLAERQQMFFVDYSLMPLFVQEHYPRMKASEHSKKGRSELACLRKAADLLAWGDTIERAIRSSGSWKLLSEQSMLSAALPTIAMDGQIRQMIQFPSWLGKNSNAGKRLRMMKQIEHHAHLKISATASSLVTDYVPVLREKLTRPLIQKEKDGVPEVLETMVEYALLKEDVDAIAELALWPGTKDPYSAIPAAVKSALTRALNKTSRMLPYMVDEMAKGRRKTADAVGEVEMDEFGNLVEKRAEDDGLEEEEEEKEKKALPPKATVASRGRGGGAARGVRGRARGK